jgi:hypothetical protein
MAVEHSESGIPNPRSAKQLTTATRAQIRGRLVRIALLLSLAALAFCLLVVWQRDARMKGAAMAWAEDVQSVLQRHLSEHASLPTEFPDAELIDLKNLEMPYPKAVDIPKLEGDPGPYVVIASPRRGLITPGGDGCAALIYDHGRFRIDWLTRADIERERAIRRELVKS